MTALPSTAALSLYDGEASLLNHAQRQKRVRAPIEVVFPPAEPPSPSKTKRRRRESLHGRSSASPNVSVRSIDDRALRTIDVTDNRSPSPNKDAASAALANVSDRLRWTPGTKSFVAVDHTQDGDYSGDTHDDEAHTRDRIVLLPTRRARDLSRIPDHRRSRRSVHDRSGTVGMGDGNEEDRSLPIDSPFHHSSRRSDLSSAYNRDSSSPIKRINLSPNKTHLSPIRMQSTPSKKDLSPLKQAFTPLMSSPLARQVDESESYLLDEDFADLMGDDWQTGQHTSTVPHHLHDEPRVRNSFKGQDSTLNAESTALQQADKTAEYSSESLASTASASLSDPSAHAETQKDLNEHTVSNSSAHLESEEDVNEASISDPSAHAESLEDVGKASESLSSAHTESQEEASVSNTSAHTQPTDFMDRDEDLEAYMHMSQDEEHGDSLDVGEEEARKTDSLAIEGLLDEDQLFDTSMAAASPEVKGIRLSTPPMASSASLALLRTRSTSRSPGMLHAGSSRSERIVETSLTSAKSTPSQHDSNTGQAQNTPRSNKRSSPDTAASVSQQERSVRDRTAAMSPTKNRSARESFSNFIRSSLAPVKTHEEFFSVQQTFHGSSAKLTPSRRQRTPSPYASSSYLCAPQTESAAITATPSPRRRLHADVVQERIQRTPLRAQSASSMQLTSPYLASEAHTPSRSGSMSLRNLLDSHRKTDGNIIHPRSPSSSIAESMATPTKSLRAVSGRKSTPHPYKLQGGPSTGSNAYEDDTNNDDDRSTRTTPKAKDDAAKLSSVKPSTAIELDFSTFLEQEDSDESDPDDVDVTELTFTKVEQPHGKAEMRLLESEATDIFRGLDDLASERSSDDAEELTGTGREIEAVDTSPGALVRNSEQSDNQDDWHASMRYDDQDSVSDEVLSDIDVNDEMEEAELAEYSDEGDDAKQLAVKSSDVSGDDTSAAGIDSVSELAEDVDEDDIRMSESASETSAGDLDQLRWQSDGYEHSRKGAIIDGLWRDRSGLNVANVTMIDSNLDREADSADQESIDEAGWMDELDRNIPKTDFESEVPSSSSDEHDSHSRADYSEFEYDGDPVAMAVDDGEEEEAESEGVVEVEDEEEMESEELDNGDFVATLLDDADDERRSDALDTGLHEHDYEDIYGHPSPVRETELETSSDETDSVAETVSDGASTSDHNSQSLRDAEDESLTTFQSRKTVRLLNTGDRINARELATPRSRDISQGIRGSTTLTGVNDSTANVSASMSTLLRRRTALLASRPNMVEVTSMNREAAARAAAILKRHHRYVQYGQLEANLDDETWAETISANLQMSESDEELEEQEMRVPSTPNAWIAGYSKRADAVPQPTSSKTTITPKPPGSFPAGNQSIENATTRTPTLALDDERTLGKMQTHHQRHRCLTRSVFSDTAWSCLEIVLLAEIVAHANAMRSQSVISKSESLLAASNELDMEEVVRFFLAAHDLREEGWSNTDTEWSLDATVRRGRTLNKRFVEDLRQRYPHLSAEEIGVRQPRPSLTADISPLLSTQALPDESNFDATQQPVSFRHVVASTPGRRIKASMADVSGHGEATERLYPDLPRSARGSVIDSGNVQRADASNLSRFVRGLGGKLASFLRTGDGEETGQAEAQDKDTERPLQNIPMREANLIDEPVTLPRRSRPSQQDSSASVVASQAAIVDSRSAHGSLPAKEVSYATGRRWQAPMQQSALSTAGLPTSSSIVSPTPARRIATGSSSYVRPTAIAMLSPATHAIAREKVDSFRDSRKDRHWRTPQRPQAPRNPGVSDVSRLSNATRNHHTRSALHNSYTR